MEGVPNTNRTEAVHKSSLALGSWQHLGRRNRKATPETVDPAVFERNVAVGINELCSGDGWEQLGEDEIASLLGPTHGALKRCPFNLQLRPQVKQGLNHEIDVVTGCTALDLADIRFPKKQAKDLEVFEEDFLDATNSTTNQARSIVGTEDDLIEMAAPSNPRPHSPPTKGLHLAEGTILGVVAMTAKSPPGPGNGLHIAHMGAPGNAAFGSTVLSAGLHNRPVGQHHATAVSLLRQ